MRGVSFSFSPSNQIKAQRSGFDLEKEEGTDGCAVFAALTQTAETERSLFLLTMARQEGFEPPTYCLEGSCSILLSYWRILQPRSNGAGDGNRTHVSSLEGWCSTIELHPQGAQSTFSLEIIPQANPECQSFFLFFPARTRNSFPIWKRIQNNLYKSDKYSIIF